jgi:hypothetical protein
MVNGFMENGKSQLDSCKRELAVVYNEFESFKELSILNDQERNTLDRNQKEFDQRIEDLINVILN